MTYKRTRILQLGEYNWLNDVKMPNDMEWHYLHPNDIEEFIKAYKSEKKQAEELDEKYFDFAGFFLTDEDYPETVALLDDIIPVHHLFYPEKFKPENQVLKDLLHRKIVQTVPTEKKGKLVKDFNRFLFDGQYGDKFHPRTFVLSSKYQTDSHFEGQNALVVESHYGEEFQQLGYYAYNQNIDSAIALDLWLEFDKDDSIELKLTVDLFALGTVNKIIESWEFSGDDFNQPMLLTTNQSGYISIAIKARGQGKFRLGPLHKRQSRGPYGYYTLGGKRFVDQNRSEFAYFFDPGDFKPPLSVYFSGYRSAEGFEGYHMMKAMGTPFMLIADPRLEGGAFYMGSEEYENEIVKVIQESLEYLGFSREQLILSGMSMGSFGALYYGADLRPHSIIMAKPVLSTGSVAKRERLERPGIFPTSLDLLLTTEGNQDQESIQDLDNRFWRKFDKADFSQTTIAVAYMKNDDYDTTAFSDIVRRTQNRHVKIIGKGWIGRHSDGSSNTIPWFLNQYKSSLAEFGRKGEF